MRHIIDFLLIYTIIATIWQAAEIAAIGYIVPNTKDTLIAAETAIIILLLLRKKGNK